MQRRHLLQGLLIAGLLASWSSLAAAQDKSAPDKPAAEKSAPEKKAEEGEAKKVELTVILPQAEDATLWINDKETNKDGKQTGMKKRRFDSSPLKPGKNYFYTFKVLWEPNNYTKMTRVRKLEVKPGGVYEVDLSKREKDDPADDIVVRFVATPDHLVDKLIEMAKVGKDDVVFDLGCGDGRMVCRAIANAGAKRGVGVDIDPERIKDSKEMARKYKVEDKVVWREGDALKQIDDLADASVVMLYMGDDIGARISPILRKTLKPGSRIVSHRFGLGDWKPDKTIRVADPFRTNSEDEVDLHLWIVPDPKKEDGKKDDAKKDDAKKGTEKGAVKSEEKTKP